MGQLCPEAGSTTPASSQGSSGVPCTGLSGCPASSGVFGMCPGRRRRGGNRRHRGGNGSGCSVGPGRWSLPGGPLSAGTKDPKAGPIPSPRSESLGPGCAQALTKSCSLKPQTQWWGQRGPGSEAQVRGRGKGVCAHGLNAPRVRGQPQPRSVQWVPGPPSRRLEPSGTKRSGSPSARRRTSRTPRHWRSRTSRPTLTTGESRPPGPSVRGGKPSCTRATDTLPATVAVNSAFQDMKCC